MQRVADLPTASPIGGPEAAEPLYVLCTAVRIEPTDPEQDVRVRDLRPPSVSGMLDSLVQDVRSCTDDLGCTELEIECTLSIGVTTKGSLIGLLGAPEASGAIRVKLRWAANGTQVAAQPDEQS